MNTESRVRSTKYSVQLDSSHPLRPRHDGHLVILSSCHLVISRPLRPRHDGHLVILSSCHLVIVCLLTALAWVTRTEASPHPPVHAPAPLLHIRFTGPAGARVTLYQRSPQ